MTQYSVLSQSEPNSLKNVEDSSLESDKINMFVPLHGQSTLLKESKIFLVTWSESMQAFSFFVKKELPL